MKSGDGFQLAVSETSSWPDFFSRAVTPRRRRALTAAPSS